MVRRRGRLAAQRRQPPAAQRARVHPGHLRARVLFASLAIFFGLLGGYFGFPRTHHPVFEVEAFRSATIDALWLSAEVDGKDAEPVAQELRRLGARHVSIVPEAT